MQSIESRSEYEGYIRSDYPSESPILPQKEITTAGINQTFLPSTSFPHEQASPPQNLSHKSTFSTLPEVTDSPNPYYYSSPIVCDPNNDIDRWRKVPDELSTDRPHAITNMGAVDTEKELYIRTATKSLPVRDKSWVGFNWVFGKQGNHSREMSHNDTNGVASVGGAVEQASSGSNENINTSPTVWGMPLKRFIWLICGMLFTVIAVAIGVGVGVGFGLANQKDNNFDTGGQNGATPIESLSTTAPTNTMNLSPTGTVSAANIKCPVADHSVYSSHEFDGATSGVGTLFLILCNTDYSAINGTVDLVSDEVRDVAECFDWCASTTGCVGAGFAFYNQKYTCWLKSSLGKPTLLSGFYFGVIESQLRKQ